MNSTGPDQLTVLTFAIVLLLPAVGVAWKAASWRGDTFNRWSDRVDVAHAGLNERVKAELLALQDEIVDVLVGAAVPAEIWIDTDPLVAGVNRCAAMLHARDRVRGRFLRYRKLGPFLIPTAAAYILGWLAATLYFTEVVHESGMKLAGFIVGAAAIVTAVTIFGCRVYFESKLTEAEELSKGGSDNLRLRRHLVRPTCGACI